VRALANLGRRALARQRINLDAFAGPGSADPSQLPAFLRGAGKVKKLRERIGAVDTTR
jgi:hypothetical protein